MPDRRVKNLHRFPFVRLKLPPKKGAKYKVGHLQPLSKMLYQRLSELTGIELEKLLPYRDFGDPNRIPGHFIPGAYLSSTHSIALVDRLEPFYLLNPSLPLVEFLDFVLRGPKTNTNQHEQMHGVVNLLQHNPNEEVEEAIAMAGGYSFSRFSATGAFKHLTKESRGLQKTVNGFYKNHGVDGLLALIAKSHEVSSSEEINILKAQLVEKGYLSGKGFTESGEQWFKKVCPSKNISAKISDMNKTRKERGLPV